MADKKNVFIIDDGTTEYSFKNQFGEPICTIHLRGGDIGIFDRFNRLTDDFDELIEPIKEVTSLRNDGTSGFEKEWEVIKEVEKKFIDRINEAFAINEAEGFFKDRHAFSTIGGVYWVEKVIEALGEIIKQEFKNESELTQERIKQYTEDIEKEKEAKE